MPRTKKGLVTPESARALQASLQEGQMPATATEQAIGGRKANPTPKPNPNPEPEPPKKRGRKPKESQPDLIEVKLDDVGKAARRFKKAVVVLEEATDERDIAGALLLGAMKAAKRNSIRIEGYLFECKHTDAKDVIRVKKSELS